VTDVDAVLANVAKLGGRQITAPQDTPYGRLATAADPTGGVFKLRG
jgi:predicted enzyme related to lactoylglutathione lyase